MKNFKLISLGLVLILTASCSVILDPLGTSIADIELSRPGAAVKLVDRTVIKVQEDVRLLAERQKWVLFQEREDDHCQVLMGIPHGIDTTETGIFITKDASGKTKIEVTSMNRKQQKIVADILFKILDETWELQK